MMLTRHLGYEYSILGITTALCMANNRTDWIGVQLRFGLLQTTLNID